VLTVGEAAFDSLQSVSICHDSAPAGQRDRSDDGRVHGRVCVICVAHASAPVDAPKLAAPVALDWWSERIVWSEAAVSFPAFRGGSNTEARAPPQLIWA
jgi:hypothetical protein